MKFLRRLFRIALFSIPFLGGGAWLAVENVLPYVPIKTIHREPQEQRWRLPGGYLPENYNLQFDSLKVKTADNVELRGYFVHAQKTEETRGKRPLTIIVLHGINGCKEHFLPTSKRFSQIGINSVLLDLRAHGTSGGAYCTFGFYEKNDISAVVDELLRQDSTQTIGILGHSLGGAIALQALAEDKRLRFGIVESTFHDLEKVVVEYGENYSGIRSPWLARHTLEKSGQIAGFDPFSVKPCESARRITQPMFMAHGSRDDRIPLEFGHQNFENLASTEKEWHTIHGARHIGLWRVGGEEYFQKMKNFIEKQRR